MEVDPSLWEPRHALVCRVVRRLHRDEDDLGVGHEAGECGKPEAGAAQQRLNGRLALWPTLLVRIVVFLHAGRVQVEPHNVVTRQAQRQGHGHPQLPKPDHPNSHDGNPSINCSRAGQHVQAEHTPASCPARAAASPAAGGVPPGLDRDHEAVAASASSARASSAAATRRATGAGPTRGELPGSLGQPVGDHLNAEIIEHARTGSLAASHAVGIRKGTDHGCGQDGRVTIRRHDPAARCPSWTTSALAPTFVTTQGRPVAIASNSAFEQPLGPRWQHEAVACPEVRPGSSTAPTIRIVAFRCALMLGRTLPSPTPTSIAFGTASRTAGQASSSTSSPFSGA